MGRRRGSAAIVSGYRRPDRQQPTTRCGLLGPPVLLDSSQIEPTGHGSGRRCGLCGSSIGHGPALPCAATTCPGENRSWRRIDRRRSPLRRFGIHTSSRGHLTFGMTLSTGPSWTSLGHDPKRRKQPVRRNADRKFRYLRQQDRRRLSPVRHDRPVTRHPGIRSTPTGGHRAGEGKPVDGFHAELTGWCRAGKSRLRTPRNSNRP